MFDGRTYDTTKPGMQIKGLTNGQNHRFTVVATNEAGDSDPSAPSADVRVDVAPEQMAAPTVVGSDGALTVSWVEPHNEGSRIQSYTVLVASANGGQPVAYSAPDSQFSMTIPGLKNGALYSVQVQAQNGAEKPSVPSSPTEGYPHGAPDQPTDVRASVVGADRDLDYAQVQVKWNVGSPNGKGWGQATVKVNGAEVQVPSADGEVTLPKVLTGSKVTASVMLSNSHGDTSAEGYATVSITTTPAPIAAPTLSGTNRAGELKVSGLARVPGRGFEVSDLTLRYSADPNSCASGEQTDDGAILHVNGWQAKTYYFCQTGINGTVSEVVPATGTATGLPSDVDVRITNVNSTSLTVEWDPVGANPEVTEVRVSLGGETKTVRGITSVTFSDLAQGTRYQATVTAVNSVGSTTMSAHPEKVTKLDVSAQWVETCHGDERGFSAASCHTFTLNAPGWSASSVTHKCEVHNDRTNSNEWVRVDGAGPIWTRQVTFADNEGAFKQDSYLIGECRPE